MQLSLPKKILLSIGVAAGIGALAGAGTIWVRIGVQLPSTADNTDQGRSATMALNWHITQKVDVMRVAGRLVL